MTNRIAITGVIFALFSVMAAPLNAAVATGSFIGINFNDWRKPTDAWLVAGGATLSDSGGGRLTPVTGTGVFINGPDGRTAHLVSTKEFGDLELHIEYMVAKGSNSGVYFMGRYEVQVFDSFGKAAPDFSDAGGIYQRWDPKRGDGKEGYEGVPPKVNAAKPAGEWQTYDVLFQAPQFDKTGKKTTNAKFIKVTHNGVVVQENVEVTGPTRAAMWEYEPEKPTGPLMLQGDHGPVAYRNLSLKWVATKADLQRK